MPEHFTTNTIAASFLDSCRLRSFCRRYNPGKVIVRRSLL